MKLLLSIIIPIYNTPCEKLQRCFASVQGIQTNTYECILVDDGSCKEIGQYAKKYASTSETFKYFRKENGGVSSARNVGIEVAAGEYIYFVDSDDAIETTARIFALLICCVLMVRKKVAGRCLIPEK